MRHPAARAQLTDLPPVERGLGRKVEAVEVAHRRKVSDLTGHLDPPLVLAGDLALDQKGQRLAQAQLALGSLVQQTVELVADRGQLQPGQRVREAGMVDAHDQPPPATRSYSASGRNSGGAVAGGTALVGGATPATPWKCRGSMTRCRCPTTSGWAATSSPRWRMYTPPCATTTCTLSPISRHGTL